MTKALYDAGKLVTDQDGKHRQVVRRVSGQRARGWLLSPKAFDGYTTSLVAEKQQQKLPVTTKTTVTTEKEQKIFGENLEDPKDSLDSKKESKEHGGDSDDIDGDFTHIVIKRFDADERHLKPGDKVDASGWRNTRQLISTRYLTPLGR